LRVAKYVLTEIQSGSNTCDRNVVANTKQLIFPSPVRIVPMACVGV